MIALSSSLPACSALSLYKVDAQSGVLSNCAALPKTPTEAADFLHRHGKVYQGGNAQILHSLLGVPCGENLMYVGDHIFADMLRSKRTLGWRTCLVVPELVQEAETYQRLGADWQELRQLRHQKEVFEAELGALLEGGQAELAARATGLKDGVATLVDEAIPVDGTRDTEDRTRLEKEIASLRAAIRSKFAEYDSAFHPRWGQVGIGLPQCHDHFFLSTLTIFVHNLSCSRRDFKNRGFRSR